MVQDKVTQHVSMLGPKAQEEAQEEATRQRMDQGCVIMLATYTNLAGDLVAPRSMLEGKLENKDDGSGSRRQVNVI